MRILHFVYVLLFASISYKTEAQSTSYYIKLEKETDIPSTVELLGKNFQAASVYQAFPTTRFNNLHCVIRIDGAALDKESVKSVLLAPTLYIETVPIAQTNHTPNDLAVEFGSPNQWYLHHIGAEQAWDYSLGNANTVVAVVDNAFLSEHEDLINKISINNAEIPNDGLDNDNNGFVDDYAGWNARSNNGDVFISSTNTSHGTHVAGIAAAQTNNDLGIASLSYSSNWLPVKVGDNSDNITHGYEGISFAVSRGAKVINCSWGTFDSSATAKSVIEYALSEQCFVVASAGNFATEQTVYPATYQGVISVAATTQSDIKLNTSSFGPRVNISAPGSGIWSTIATETAASSYGFMSGTSMASPLTASLLALMSAYAPSGSDSVILHCLYFTAVDIYNIPGNAAYDSLLGAGRIDAENAMRCLNQTLHLSVSESEQSQALVWAFPNPNTTGMFSLAYGEETTESDLSWKVLNTQGKTLQSGTGKQVDISKQAAGIYILQIQRKGSVSPHTVKLIRY